MLCVNTYFINELFYYLIYVVFTVWNVIFVNLNTFELLSFSKLDYLIKKLLFSL